MLPDMTINPLPSVAWEGALAAPPPWVVKSHYISFTCIARFFGISISMYPRIYSSLKGLSLICHAEHTERQL